MEFGLEKALDILRKFPGKEHKEVASYIQTLILMSLERQKQIRLLETDENREGITKEAFI